MTDKKYFRGMLIGIGCLFLITCFSIIFCLLKTDTVDASQTSSHIMSIVYMFFQLIMESIVFYYSFKAMINGSSLLKNAMYVKEGVVNKKSKRNALIVFVVGFDLAIYFLLTILPLDIFLSFFALGLKFALLNFFLLLGIVGLYFFCYPRNKEEEK